MDINHRVISIEVETETSTFQQFMLTKQSSANKVSMSKYKNAVKQRPDNRNNFVKTTKTC